MAGATAVLTETDLLRPVCDGRVADLLAGIERHRRAMPALPDLASGLEALRTLGALHAVLPLRCGGLGLGSDNDPRLVLAALAALRQIGAWDLALGRCFEGHLNVARLVGLYGDTTASAVLTRSARDGHLSGLWVTDGREPVTIRGARLSGVKGFASGVRAAGMALITAHNGVSDVMYLLPVGETERIGPGPGKLTGMHRSGTGSYRFEGLTVASGARVGVPGDYLRQPEFSAGAWRGSAVALGGIDRLVDLLRSELAARGRADNPHQQARIGAALIARETAVLWTRRAALLAHNPDAEPGDVTAIVNLARLAVERAGLEVIALVQRGLGLSAFVEANPAETVLRDLATYLRQPAPDESLTEAAAWFTERDPEDLDIMR